MHKSSLFRISFLILILFWPAGYLFSQVKLDHEVFIEKIRHSNDNIYQECIKEYNTYLGEFPDDIAVLIEKCKFIQLAQYDAENEYNPNQQEFDSCTADLAKRFTSNPKVLLFQTTYSWSEQLEEVFEKANKSIEENRELWSKEDLALMYKSMSEHYYNDSDYTSALKYIAKAISNDEAYKSSIDYASILIELDRKMEAIEVLTANMDSSAWELSRKAELFLKIKAYPQALATYDRLREVDSTYVDNAELASTFEGIGQYDLARKCLVSDTSVFWQKEEALHALFIHDLKFQDGAQCAASYNAFRDLGYLYDPLGFYRLKLFFSHPLESWRFRDVLAILALILVLVLFIIAPYILILPVYFAGYRFSRVANKNPFDTPWGLKMFWLVCTGYLFASLFSCFGAPETLISIFNSELGDLELTEGQMGLQSLLFMVIMAVFGFAALYKVKYNVLLSTRWSVGNSIWTGIWLFVVYKIVTGVYIQIGVKSFGISFDEVASIQNILLASREIIEAIIATYGKGASFLLIGLIVPFYEEVIFRGVILSSCQRYINFNLANVFQAVLFSLVHQSLFLFPVFFIFGMMAGILRKRSGGLLSGMVLHSANNILVMLILFIKL